MTPEDDSMLGQNLVDVRNEERRNAMRGEQIEMRDTTLLENQITGELISLTDPQQCAKALAEVREAKVYLDELRRVLEEVLRIECERQGTKTLHFDGMDAVLTGGTKTEYDFLALADELRELGLPEERVGLLIVETITYKLNRNVAKQLRVNPDYADALDRHTETVPAAWRVDVKKGP